MLSAADFPEGTPLHHFFAWNAQVWNGQVWNARVWHSDRRYRLARDPDRLPAGAPLRMALSDAIGSTDIAAHAAVFAAFEATAVESTASRRILIIRLSAFGDFIQALGPITAIRRHHAGDHISLLTTGPLAGFAGELGLFDEIIVDERPKALDLAGWLALRRRLRRAGFDRVYDLQTSQRSALYFWLMRPCMPEWSGIAPGCSHPHANLGRDAQHTLDKQAEQLLMAGVYPTPLPKLPPLHRPLPTDLTGQDFVLLVPGSSPQHPEKRWPAEAFAALARWLVESGCVPVVVGTPPEKPLAAAIRETCPLAVDLVGRTDLGLLGALAQSARLTIGNDTGVCHLAAAAGCPVIVLFSKASDPAKCAPRGRSVQVLSNPDLTHLPVDDVTTATAVVLQQRLATQSVGRT